MVWTRNSDKDAESLEGDLGDSLNEDCDVSAGKTHTKSTETELCSSFRGSYAAGKFFSVEEVTVISANTVGSDCEEDGTTSS